MLQQCEECLGKISLPDTNVHLVCLRDKAFDLAIQAQKFDVAATIGSKNIKAFKWVTCENIHRYLLTYLFFIKANLKRMIY